LSTKRIKKEVYVKKFAAWIKSHDKKHRAIAEKLGISTSTMHQILKQGRMPSILVAYEIERYTHGAITLYDWIDGSKEGKKERQVEKQTSKVTCSGSNTFKEN
jgi:transcriptional regulator with XRE-family HTH domain